MTSKTFIDVQKLNFIVESLLSIGVLMTIKQRKKIQQRYCNSQTGLGLI